MPFENIPKHGIIKNERVTTEKYKPRRIIGRKSEIKKLEMPLISTLRDTPLLKNIALYGLSGTGKCVEKGTKIFTTDGWKNIEDVNKNERILTLNLKTLKYEYDSCNPVQLNNEEPVNSLKLENGMTITCTKEHPLLIMNKNGKLKWKKSDKLEVGDYLSVVEKIPPAGILASEDIGNEFSRLLGFIISDGHIENSRAKSKPQWNCYNRFIMFSNNDEFLLNKFMADIKTLFPNSKPKLRQKKTYKQVEIYSKEIVNFFIKFVPYGNKSKIVKIPKVIFGAKIENQREFIKAMFSCDGYIENPQKKRYNIEYYSSSEELIKDLSLLLLHFGIRNKIRYKKAKLNGKEFDSYRLLISDGTSLMRFYKELGFYSPKKQKRLEENYIKKVKTWRWSKYTVPYQYDNLRKSVKDRKRKTLSVCNPYYLYEKKRKIGKDKLNYIVDKLGLKGYIRKVAKSPLLWSKITKIGKKKLSVVYDVTCEKNHSFIANGIISHNTLIVDYMLDELQEKYKKFKKNDNLKIIRIKGSEQYTKFKIMKAIYTDLYKKDPHRDSDEVYIGILNYIKTHNALVYVFIDEIHELDEKELNRLLYTLSRFGEDLIYHKPKQKSMSNTEGDIGFLVVSNDPNIKDKLKHNTMSTFRFAEPIMFNKYNPEQIYEILVGRINEGALRKDAITNGNLKLISALSADEGDARYAILLLSLSARISETMGLSKIQADVIKKANDDLRENLLRNILEDLSGLSCEVLSQMYFLYEGEKEITTGTIYERMKNNGSKVSLSRVSQIVSDLLKNNIVYKGRTGRRGYSRKILLDETFDVIKAFLEEKHMT